MFVTFTLLTLIVCIGQAFSVSSDLAGDTTAVGVPVASGSDRPSVMHFVLQELIPILVDELETRKRDFAALMSEIRPKLTSLQEDLAQYRKREDNLTNVESRKLVGSLSPKVMEMRALLSRLIEMVIPDIPYADLCDRIPPLEQIPKILDALKKTGDLNDLSIQDTEYILQLVDNLQYSKSLDVMIESLKSSMDLTDLEIVLRSTGGYYKVDEYAIGSRSIGTISLLSIRSAICRIYPALKVIPSSSSQSQPLTKFHSLKIEALISKIARKKTRGLTICAEDFQ